MIAISMDINSTQREEDPHNNATVLHQDFKFSDGASKNKVHRVFRLGSKFRTGEIKDIILIIHGDKWKT